MISFVCHSVSQWVFPIPSADFQTFLSENMNFRVGAVDEVRRELQVTTISDKQKPSKVTDSEVALRLPISLARCALL